MDNGNDEAVGPTSDESEMDPEVTQFDTEVNQESEMEVRVDPDTKKKKRDAPDFKVDCDADVDLKFNVELSGIVEDREFDFLRVDQPSTGYGRSSSLKASAGRSSAGSPSHHQKKAVRFADALGLDLESIRHILNTSDPPIVPSSAMRDLNLNTDSELNRNSSRRTGSTLEVPCLRAWFSNPATLPDFERQVQERKIRLATCVLDSVNMTVSGTVTVANIAYEKSVTVRYTTNAWVTFTDVVARYISGSGRTDYFQFVIELGNYFAIGSKMEFSVRLSCDDQTYWDGNDGFNYRVECCVALNL